MEVEVPTSPGRRSHGRKGAPFLAAFALMAAAPAFAHHSAAMFDSTKTVEVKGTVKKFLWTNPHSFLLVTTRTPAGQTVDYAFEANGPGYLVRTGWKRESAKPGDMVTVTMNPLRDGSPGGNLVEVAFADGRKLSTRVVRPGGATGGPPGGAPPAGAPPAAAPAGAAP